MSHCNITLRDRYSSVEQLRLKVRQLETEKSHLEGILESAESNLKSIFDRVKNGEEVYLDYPDNTRIYLKGHPAP